MGVIVNNISYHDKNIFHDINFNIKSKLGNFKENFGHVQTLDLNRSSMI